MCKAMEFTKQIQNVLQDAKEERLRLGFLCSQCDLKIQDLLHQIENEPIGGMYNAYKIVIQIKEIRQFRRKVKDEREKLNLFMDYRKIQKEECKNLIELISKKERKMGYRKYRIRVNYPTEKLLNYKI